MTYLLDTNICIYALKNRPPEVLERLEAVGRGAVALSVITVLELRQGVEKSQRDLDTLIAAHAIALDLILVTNNLQEFERVPGLKTENWVR